MKLKLLLYPQFWWELRWNIRDFFRPRQSWLTSKIPNNWTDKDNLIWLCISECLKHYVEKEIGKDELFNKDRWTEEDYKIHNGVNLRQINFENELKQHYLLLTEERPKLEKEMNLLWETGPSFDLDDLNMDQNSERYLTWKAKMDKINEYEARIFDLETRIMNWVVLNRASMWT